MTSQLTLEDKEQRVCVGCGCPRPDWATDTYTNVLKDRCTACRLLAGEEQAECDGCGKVELEDDLDELFYYFSPFDDEESSTGFRYCGPCFEQGGLDDDYTFTCERCERQITDSQGHMTYYRIIDECEMVCLRCVEEVLQDEGIAGFECEMEKLFNHGALFGMFFNVGEPEADGWERELYDVRVAGTEGAMVIANKAKELHEDGRRILIGYERLSICGGEGYVSLYSKPPKEDD